MGRPTDRRSTFESSYWRHLESLTAELVGADAEPTAVEQRLLEQAALISARADNLRLQMFDAAAISADSDTRLIQLSRVLAMILKMLIGRKREARAPSLAEYLESVDAKQDQNGS